MSHVPHVLEEIPAKHLRELDEDLDKLRQFNDEAFHKFAPVLLGLHKVGWCSQ